MTLAEVLTEEECRAIQAGKLVAISELGALMSFSSPLQDGALIKLCPPTPEILSIFRLPD